MKLARLVTENVRGVPNGAYAFGPNGNRPNDLTLIAGVRGSGKTRLLEAIVALKELVGAYGNPPARSALLEPGTPSGLLGGTFILSAEEMKTAEVDAAELHVQFPLGGADAPELPPLGIRKLFARFDHSPEHGKLEYFPAARRLVTRGAAIMKEVDEGLVRAASEPEKYRGLLPAIIALSLADGARAIEEAMARGVLLGTDAPDSLAAYRAAMSAVVPELRLLGVQRDENGEPALFFVRRSGAPIEARQLSGGQAQGVLLAGSMIRLGLSNSLLLLDVPELHVHVADQARFLQGLVGLGHDNQWIVATGSGEIMKEARREQVIALPMPK